MPKKKTYGFASKKVAEDLSAMVASNDRTHREGRGGAPTRLFRFTLNASLASGSADADILWMDGTDSGLDATVYDPLGIFATLVTVGDTGLCLLQGDRYYVIQANCP